MKKITLSGLLVFSFILAFGSAERSRSSESLNLTDTIWQNYDKMASPNKTTAFLNLKITNDKLQPLREINIFLKSKYEEVIYAAKTDSQGEVYFLVPNGASYEINILDVEAYRTVALRNAPNLTKRMGFTFAGKKHENHWDWHKMDDIGKLDTIVQNVKVNQKPTDKQAVIHIALRDLDGYPQRGVNVTLMDRENKLVYKSHTHSNGVADFFIPNGITYWVGVGINPQFSLLEVEDLPGLEGTKRFVYQPTILTEKETNDTINQVLRRNQKSTSDRVYVEAFVENLEYKPLFGEQFMMRSKKSDKVYYGETDKNGTVRLLLPKGDTYYISFEYRDIGDSAVFKYDNSFGKLRIEYRYIGSKEYKRRMLERARLARIRDSLDRIRRYNDSLRIELMGSENFLEQIEWGKDKDKIKKLIAKRALLEKEKLKKDPKFFVKAGREIQAVLYRMRNKWKDKVIVTDLTGSMYPYMDQILVWHAFNNMVDKGNDYIFFNDGDRKPLCQKLIGKTGGIYTADNNSMDEVLQTMLTTMQGGGGAELPENDLEALWKSQHLVKLAAELILVADNYSDVRDLQLLKYMKVPVRVVLCGVQYGINEHYLEIAYATNGSVHTIEEDIEDLKSLVRGNEITVGGQTYKFNKGKFLKID